MAKKKVSADGKKNGKKSKKGSFFRRIMVWLRNLVIFFFVSTILVTIIYRFFPVYVTPLMVIRTAEQLFGKEKVSMKKEWVPISEMSVNMVNAVIASEDNNFICHHGFDFEAIQKAQQRNKKGGKVYGASTISQQTAKNVFLWPGRTWFRKGLEVYFTGLIELLWSKERIMEVYLNVIETGNGIYGVERASQVYFNKPARKLTKSQSALIAASLPNPRRFDPSRPSSYMYKREKQILKLMKLLGDVNFEQKK